MKGTVISNEDQEVYDLFGIENFSPANIEEQLNDANGDDVTVEINSPGGYISAGSEIYTALKQYPGKVTANIVGQACSAASWIALAADHVAMSPTAQMMIHRASGGTYGNSDDLTSALNALDEMDKSFVDLYAKKTGKQPGDIFAMMQKETWMNAKTAYDNGFVDEIMFADETPAAVNSSGNVIFTSQMISKIKNLIHKSKTSSDDDKPIQTNQKENSKNKGQTKKDLSLLLWQ